MIKNKLPLIGVLVLLSLMMAACRDEPDPVPQPQPRTVAPATSNNPTAIPVVTRIVTLTPIPTPTPTFTPTPNFELAFIEGSWVLMLRVEVLDSGFADEMVYSASAGVTIGLDSSVTGSGQFGQTLSYRDCVLVASNETPPGFQIMGELQPVGENFMLDLTVIPDDPAYVETYTRTCFDQSGAAIEEETTVSLLWRALEATDALNFTVDLAQLSNRITNEYDLAAITNNELQGTLQMEFYFGR